MRDNWCIGYSTRYTVGGWVGNKEGDPMRAVSGTSGAAPVWRDVMPAIHDGARPPAPKRPARVDRKSVAWGKGASGLVYLAGRPIMKTHSHERACCTTNQFMNKTTQE